MTDEATRAGEEIVRATGSLKRDKNIPVTVEGRGYALVNEWSKNWIVDDAAGDKVQVEMNTYDLSKGRINYRFK